MKNRVIIAEFLGLLTERSTWK